MKQKNNSTTNIVLLHGWGAHSKIWNSLIQEMNDFELHTIDYPGHGKNHAFVFPSYIRELAFWIAQQINSSTIFIGWSLGGLVALAMAKYYPDIVKKIFLIASSPYFMSQKDWPGFSLEQFDHLVHLIKKNPQLALKKHVSWQLHPHSFNKDLIKTYTNILGEYPIPNVDTLLSGLALIHDLDFRDLLVEIQIPIYYLFGENDVLVPVHLTKHLQKISPPSRISIIADAGHLPFLTHSQITANILRGWIYENTSE